MMMQYKTVARFVYSKSEYLEIPLYYKTKEDLQIVTFLIIGTLSDCPGLTLENYIFSSNTFVKLPHGDYIQRSNKRRGMLTCDKGVYYASRYTFKNNRTKQSHDVEFTFLSPNHLATLYQYLVPAGQGFITNVRHFRRTEYGGDWYETRIVPMALGYPSTGVASNEPVK